MTKERIVIIAFVLISITIASSGYYMLKEVVFTEREKRWLGNFYGEASGVNKSLEKKSKIFVHIYLANVNLTASLLWGGLILLESLVLSTFREKLLKEKSPWKNRTVLLTYIIASAFMLHEMIFDLPFRLD